MTRDRLPGTGPPAQVVSDAARVDRSRAEKRGSGKKDAAAVLRAALPGRALCMLAAVWERFGPGRAGVYRLVRRVASHGRWGLKRPGTG